MRLRFASLLSSLFTGLVTFGLVSPALAAPMPEPVADEPSVAELSTAETAAPEEAAPEEVASPEEVAAAATPETPTTAELDPIDETIPPEPRRRTSFGQIFGDAWIGQVAGAALGAGIGLGIAGAVGCDERGQGWMAGYTCTSGYFYLAVIGAILAAPLGTITGILIGLDARGVHRDVAGDVALGTLLGWLPALLALPLHLLTGQLSGPLVYALAAGGGLSPVMGAAFAIDPLRRSGLAVAPFATPMADGAVVGFRGRF
ncbi:MAG: hypothetical protein KC619_31025 [Myxococcales bacterium]|nr:hypothetical protein [Myxococcales bacterium]